MKAFPYMCVSLFVCFFVSLFVCLFSCSSSTTSSRAGVIVMPFHISITIREKISEARINKRAESYVVNPVCLARLLNPECLDENFALVLQLRE